MEATCVTHVGVCVRDMEKSLAFYRDALGMKVLGEKTTDPSEGGQQGGRMWCSPIEPSGTLLKCITCNQLWASIFGIYMAEF